MLLQVYRDGGLHHDTNGVFCGGDRNRVSVDDRMSAGNLPRDPALDRPDRVDAIIAFLSPTIDEILSRLEGDEFTTTEFIELLQSDPGANAAYLEALRRWGEGDRYAKMVVHGQVIPGILRRSDLVEWLGFAHGVVDSYAVPARWRIVEDPSSRSGVDTGTETQPDEPNVS
jgi:hypothetical protein